MTTKIHNLDQVSVYILCIIYLFIYFIFDVKDIIEIQEEYDPVKEEEWKRSIDSVIFLYLCIVIR